MTSYLQELTEYLGAQHVTRADLKTLTGYHWPRAQGKFLAARGIAFRIRADGATLLRLDELNEHTLSKRKRAQPKGRFRSMRRPDVDDSKPLFLSPDELKAFTGKVRPSAQVKFLRSRNIMFITRDDGTVALRHTELDLQTLSVPPRPKPEDDPDYGCNWEALRNGTPAPPCPITEAFRREAAERKAKRREERARALGRLRQPPKRPAG